MGMLDLLRKGFGYVLMSLGASSPEAARKKAAPGPQTKPADAANKGWQDEDSPSKGSEAG